MDTRKGFSLLELCVVLVLITGLLIIAISVTKPLRERGEVRTAAQTVREAMREARTRAITDSCPCQVTVLSNKSIQLDWVARFIDLPDDPWTPTHPPPGTVWSPFLPEDSPDARFRNDCVYIKHESALYRIFGNVQIQSSVTSFPFDESGGCPGVRFEVRGTPEVPVSVVTVTPSGRVKG